MKNNNDISLDRLQNWLQENPDEPLPDGLLEQSEEALLQFAKAHELPPPDHLRSQILGKLKSLDRQKKHRQPLSLDNLPPLDADSNWLDWQAAVAHLEPPADYEGVHLHTLESNEKRELFVAWVKEYVEEEVHHDLLESFLILEGSCECHITDEQGNTRTVRLGQGGYITMQLGETHDIRITSREPAKAILQWAKLAA